VIRTARGSASRRVLENCGFRFVGEESDDDVRLWVLQLD
jgi:RimJ/RimL family protein N-acetyltransferase